MRHLWVAATVGTAVLAFAAPRGTLPLSSASRYPAHAQRDDVSVGAELLSPAKVQRTFVSDLKRCCVVVELAVYPQGDRALDVSLNDLSLRVAGADTAVKASSAKLVAASLQKDAISQRDVTVSPEVGVGYSSGTVYDPATGMVRGGGVVTEAGVGVGLGGSGSAPGSSAQDRSTMELELGEKSLPEGSTSAPVAGYVYFPLSSRKKKAAYQLEYTVGGEKIVLPLSQ